MLNTIVSEEHATFIFWAETNNSENDLHQCHFSHKNLSWRRPELNLDSRGKKLASSHLQSPLLITSIKYAIKNNPVQITDAKPKHVPDIHAVIKVWVYMCKLIYTPYVHTTSLLPLRIHSNLSIRSPPSPSSTGSSCHQSLHSQEHFPISFLSHIAGSSLVH
jgi:hypothetical protein